MAAADSAGHLSQPGKILACWNHVANKYILLGAIEVAFFDQAQIIEQFFGFLVAVTRFGAAE